MVTGYVIVSILEQPTAECSIKLRQRETQQTWCECVGKPGRKDFLVEVRIRVWIGEAEEARKGQQWENKETIWWALHSTYRHLPFLFLFWIWLALRSENPNPSQSQWQYLSIKDFKDWSYLDQDPRTRLSKETTLLRNSLPPPTPQHICMLKYVHRHFKTNSHLLFFVRGIKALPHIWIIFD